MKSGSHIFIWILPFSLFQTQSRISLSQTLQVRHDVGLHLAKLSKNAVRHSPAEVFDNKDVIHTIPFLCSDNLQASRQMVRAPSTLLGPLVRMR